MDVYTGIIWLSGFCIGCGTTVLAAAVCVWMFEYDA